MSPCKNCKESFDSLFSSLSSNVLFSYVPKYNALKYKAIIQIKLIANKIIIKIHWWYNFPRIGCRVSSVRLPLTCDSPVCARHVFPTNRLLIFVFVFININVNVWITRAVSSFLFGHFNAVISAILLPYPPNIPISSKSSDMIRGSN